MSQLGSATELFWATLMKFPTVYRVTNVWAPLVVRVAVNFESRVREVDASRFCDVARRDGVSPDSGLRESRIGSSFVPAFNGFPADTGLLSITGDPGAPVLVLFGITRFQQARCPISGRSEQLCSNQPEDRGELCS